MDNIVLESQGRCQVFPLTIHDPWHLVDENVVQRLGIIGFKCAEKDIDVLHVDIG